MEVAGLVITVVPLMISALKQYTEARRGLRRFRRTSLYLSRLIQALREQKFLLETDLQQLLRAAGSEDDIVSDDHGDSQAFVLKSDVAAKLRSYMDKAYDPYIQALGLCEESVKEVVKRIWKCVPGCESSSLADVMEANKSKSGKSTFLRRIKLSLDNREIERLVGDIESASKRLRRLSKCATLAHDMRSASTKVSKFTKFLQRVRTQVDKLYWVVADSFSSCCHDEHDTKLLLNDRLKQFKTTQKPISFSLAIMSPLTAGSRNLLSHSMQVDVLEDEASSSTDHLHCRGRKVAFTIPHEEPSPIHTQGNRVSNICQSLSNSQMKSKLHQLYLSQRNSLSYRAVSTSVTTGSNPLSLRIDQRPEQIFTLKRILLQSANLEVSPNAKGWSRDQRMALSFKLASSLLQLCSTPWLMNAWTKEEICFMHLGSSHTNSDGPLNFEVKHPFIIHKFTKNPERHLPDKRAVKRQMLELGVLLLEISHETSLEDWAATVGLTVQSSYASRYDAARKWLFESDTVLVSYWDASTIRLARLGFQEVRLRMGCQAALPQFLLSG